MRNVFLTILAFAVVFACSAAAADIDGKWVFESKLAAGKKGGEAVTVKNTLNLKANGSSLTGTVSMGGRKKDTSASVKDGKIEGNKFSFVTVVTGKKADQKVTWSGTVEGNELKGTRSREGAKRGQPFTAKKT